MDATLAGITVFPESIAFFVWGPWVQCVVLGPSAVLTCDGATMDLHSETVHNHFHPCDVLASEAPFNR